MANFTKGGVLQILQLVQAHIQFQRRGGRTVITISLVVTPWSALRIYLDYVEADMLSVFRWLNANKVAVVCSAGNYAQDLDEEEEPRTYVDTLPALFASDSSFPIVAGNSDIYGKRQPSSQQTLKSPQIYAPGVNIKCADVASVNGFRVDSGTSYCK